MSSERRKYVRFDTILDGTFQIKNCDIEGLIVMSNVSREGFGATLNREVTPGRILEFEMRLPQNIMPFFARGKLIWVQPNDKNTSPGFDAGIQLEEIDPLERQMILDYAYKALYSLKTGKNAEEFNVQP